MTNNHQQPPDLISTRKTQPAFSLFCLDFSCCFSGEGHEQKDEEYLFLPEEDDDNDDVDVTNNVINKGLVSSKGRGVNGTKQHHHEEHDVATEVSSFQTEEVSESRSTGSFQQALTSTYETILSVATPHQKKREQEENHDSEVDNDVIPTTPVTDTAEQVVVDIEAIEEEDDSFETAPTPSAELLRTDNMTLYKSVFSAVKLVLTPTPRKTASSSQTQQPASGKKLVF